MSTPNCLPCATIKRWEEAGASLLAAFKNYADLCPSLGTDSLNEGAKPEDLATRIESILETVHAVVSGQLPETTAILLRTRNKSITPISRFPEEVLAEIFANAIFDRHNRNGPLTMKSNLRMIYDRLHKLRRVCSTWNDIIIARGVLWSVVPLILSRNPSPYQMSLQRAGSQLHLAADIESDEPLNSHDLAETDDMGGVLYELLSEYGPRFRTISLVVHENYPEILRSAIDRLLQHGTALSLSQLSMSLCDSNSFISSVDSRTGFPADHWWILPHGSPQQTLFASLLASLTTLRIHRVHFHWENMAFSSRLVDLRVQNVTLGYDDAIAPFLHALTSASELRDLAIIDVRSFVKTGAAVDPKSFPVVTLPKLQCLFIEGLYLNTLELVLPQFSPGSSCLKLCLGPKSTKINRKDRRNSFGQLLPPLTEPDTNDGDDDDGDHSLTANIERLLAILGSIQVDTLVLQPFQDEMTLSSFLLRIFMRVLPDLKTLKAYDWDLFEDDFEWAPGHLILSFEEELNPHWQYPSSSTLEILHLTGIRIHHRGVLRETVANFPLQKIVIGGYEETGGRDTIEGYSLEPLEESQAIPNWLRDNAPNVCLVDSDHYPTELDMTRWQPWY